MAYREKKRVLEKRAREFVVFLRDYFEREQQNGGPLLPLTRVVERVSDALKIGTNTVCRITREKYGKSGMEDNELKTPSYTPHTRRKRKTDKSSKSTNNGKKVSKECNLRVNGVSTNKSKTKVNTTESKIRVNLKTVPNITSSRGKFQKTCITKAAPKLTPKTDLSFQLPKICNPMVSAFERTANKSISSDKTDDTKSPFSKTSTKRKCQNTSLSSKSPLDPVHIEIPFLSPVIHGLESITASTINPYHKKDHLIGETSTKRKCRTMSSKSLLDPIYDMPNIFSPTLSDFGSTTDSTTTGIKSENKNTPILHTSTKTNPAKDYSMKLEFKVDLDDNIILVVHPTIDDHLPMNTWQNNKTLY